jgi:hypothetical protein
MVAISVNFLDVFAEESFNLVETRARDVVGSMGEKLERDVYISLERGVVL